MSNFLKLLSGRPVGTAMVLGDLPSIANNTALANISGSSTTPSAVSLVSTATASTIMLRDTNANTRVNNLIENFTTTATAAGTTTLTVSSTYFQQFTGTTTQTVVLPDATTLVVGQAFSITNRSTGTVTVNANGGGLIQTMVAGSQTIVTVTSIGTSAGTWDSSYSTTAGGGGGFANPMTTLGDIITGGSGGTAQRLGIGTPGQVLTTTSGTPAWSTPTVSSAVPPTVQKFLSGSGTYTTPNGVLYIRVRMVGGGGGGAGGGNGTTGGTAGGNSTFGTSLLTANGGGAGTWFAAPGAGGTATVSAPATQIVALTGGTANGGPESVGSNVIANGGTGASSPFGGAGGGGMYNSIVGSAAVANSGSGGGGGGATNVNGQLGGGGGAAGGYIEAIITNPVASYSYSVGSAGTAGTSTGGGSNGGAGGSGYIEITEYYASGASTTQAVPPTIQKFITGSGTYNTPAGALYIRVRMVGAGGGGGSVGTAGTGATGSAGSGATTFGTSLLSAGAGSGGIGSQGSGSGGNGGTASLGTGPIGTAVPGSAGSTGGNSNANGGGGTGGASAFGGAGQGGAGNAPNAGSNAATNSGSGGGGAAFAVSTAAGGGGAGGYIDAIITNPTSTYSYSIATGGNGGAAGTSGAAGGNGASGYIEVTEYYAAGGTTVWGGIKNYLSDYIASTSSNVKNAGNGNFELATTAGWSLAHSSLSSVTPTSTASAGNPFSATSGGSAASGNLSLSLVSSGNQIGGNYSGSLASTAASTAGDMLISNAFYIDKEDQAKVQTVKFYYNVNSGAANLNFSGTSSNSFALWIYDVTNAAWIMPAGVYNTVQSSGTGYCTATFQTTSNSTQYQLALININASAGAYTLYLDDLFVGPQTSPMAPAMSDWISFPMVIEGVSTDPTKGATTVDSAMWRRVGDSMEISYEYIQTGAGSPGSGAYLFDLPSGYTIDTNKMNVSTQPDVIVGISKWSNVAGSQGTTTILGVVSPYNNHQLFLPMMDASANNLQTDLFLFGSGQGFGNTNVRLTFQAKVPIAGWSSNSVASSDTDTRVVAATVQGQISNSPTAGNPIIFPTVVKDTHAAYNNSTGQYTTPVTGYYSVSCAFSVNTIAIDTAVYVYVAGSQNQLVGITSVATVFGGGTAVVYANAGQTIDVRATNNITAGSGNPGSLTINRISGPAVITASESVNATYLVSATYTPGATTAINFDTLVFDSHNAVTTGAGTWKFTCPVSGKYSISSLIGQGNSTASASAVYKNGSLYLPLGICPSTGNGQCGGSMTIPLLAGDTVNIQLNATMSVSGSTLGSSFIGSYISIFRVGN